MCMGRTFSLVTTFVPVLIGRQRRITFGCYDLENNSVNDVTFVMRWAIAYAVNLKLQYSGEDGVLGLSLSKCVVLFGATTTC